MNWVAHLLLAKPSSKGRLGNLLGDLIQGESRKSLTHRLQMADDRILATN